MPHQVLEMLAFHARVMVVTCHVISSVMALLHVTVGSALKAINARHVLMAFSVYRQRYVWLIFVCLLKEDPFLEERWLGLSCLGEMVETQLFGRDDWDRVLGRHGLDPVPWEAWLGTQLLRRHGLHPVLGDRRLILSHMSWYVTVNFFDKASFPVCVTCLTCYIIWYEFQIKNS